MRAERKKRNSRREREGAQRKKRDNSESGDK